MKFKTLRKVALTTCMVLFALTMTAFGTSDITPYAIECGNCRTGVLLPYSKQIDTTTVEKTSYVYNCIYTREYGTIQRGQQCNYCGYKKITSQNKEVLRSYHSREHN